MLLLYIYYTIQPAFHGLFIKKIRSIPYRCVFRARSTNLRDRKENILSFDYRENVVQARKKLREEGVSTPMSKLFSKFQHEDKMKAPIEANRLFVIDEIDET